MFDHAVAFFMAFWRRLLRCAAQRGFLCGSGCGGWHGLVEVGAPWASSALL